MAYQNILCDVKDQIAIVTMNNEKSLNALNAATVGELDDCFRKLDTDENVDVIIVTGAGRAFIAGADIKEMQNLGMFEAERFAKSGLDLFRFIEKMGKPVIAAINGFALGGGCELSMACDIRIASSKALFGQPEVGLGIIPGFGGTQRLERLVGLGMAKQMILSGENIKANRALEIGLVNEVLEPEKLMDRALEIAKKIASNAQLAVRVAKNAMNTGYQTDIDSSMDIERVQFARCFTTQDQKEGMTAFVEKRAANFKKC